MTIQEQNKTAPQNADLFTNDPLALFSAWLRDAELNEIAYPNAMTVASVNENGRPSARTVLLRAHGPEGFVFYTNFESRKGHELLSTPQAMMLFYWKSLERQVRIEGPINPVDNATADAYFAQRPRDSQIGAWASLQSTQLDARETFEQRIEEYRAKFEGQDVPRPPHWSGFCLNPDKIEFWIEREFRLHERILYTKTPEGWDKGQLLYP